MQQGFLTLLPYSRLKDTKRHHNLQVDDICLIRYETKVAATYRLCHVLKVFPSEEGVVQTVEVQLWALLWLGPLLIMALQVERV